MASQTKYTVGITDTTLFTAVNGEYWFYLESGSGVAIVGYTGGNFTSHVLMNRESEPQHMSVTAGDVIHAIAPYGAEISVITY